MTRKKKEIEPRKCPECRIFFTPARGHAVYCSDKCRTKAHADLRRNLVYDHKAAEIDSREVPVMQSRQEREQQLGQFYSKKVGANCVYCGIEAECSDHVIPLRAMELVYTQHILYKFPMVRSEIVPACHKCNGIAGDKVFRGIEDKTRYIHKRRQALDLPIYISTPERNYFVDHTTVTVLGEKEICATCKELFVATRNGQKFCSNECLHSYKGKA